MVLLPAEKQGGGLGRAGVTEGTDSASYLAARKETSELLKGSLR